jgi:hypothetical protein
MCWLIRGRKVGEIQPIPGCDKDILGLDVAMIDVPGVAVSYSAKELEREPFLLYLFQEWTCTTWC